MLVLCARAQARAPAPRQHYPPNVLRRHVSGLQTHDTHNGIPPVRAKIGNYPKNSNFKL